MMPDAAPIVASKPKKKARIKDAESGDGARQIVGSGRGGKLAKAEAPMTHG